LGCRRWSSVSSPRWSYGEPGLESAGIDRLGRGDGRALRRRTSLQARSRGGVTKNFHLAADSQCRPIARVTTAGQRHDSLAFIPVMADIAIIRSCGGTTRSTPDRVLADKATPPGRLGMRCGAEVSRRRSRNRRTRSPAVRVVVPGGGRPRNSTSRSRNTVERAINRLRGYRAVATRYDKREFVYKGTIDVAGTGIWQPASGPAGVAVVAGHRGDGLGSGWDQNGGRGDRGSSGHGGGNWTIRS